LSIQYDIDRFRAFLFLMESGLTFRVEDGLVQEGGWGYTLKVGPADKAGRYEAQIKEHREALIELSIPNRWTASFANDLVFCSIRYAVRVDRRPLGVGYWTEMTYPELYERFRKEKDAEQQAIREERWEDFQGHLYSCYKLHEQMAAKYVARTTDTLQPTLF
jgi:hypothetical protein